MAGLYACQTFSVFCPISVEKQNIMSFLFSCSYDDENIHDIESIDQTWKKDGDRYFILHPFGPVVKTLNKIEFFMVTNFHRMQLSYILC